MRHIELTYSQSNYGKPSSQRDIEIVYIKSKNYLEQIYIKSKNSLEKLYSKSKKNKLSKSHS